MDDHEDAFLAAVNTTLRTSVTAATERLRAIDPGLAPFAELCLSAATVGGKRLRPRFAYWAWRTVVRHDEQTARVVDVGAALELLHAAILVHDDIIDDSELRRGQPSVRTVLAGQHRTNGWAGSARGYGDHAALLIGDLMWGSAHDLFDAAVADLDPGRRRQAVDTFRVMRIEVVSGQLLELRAQAAGDLAMSAAEKILQYKTSGYTVERPMQIGLELSGAGPDTAAALAGFARAIGHAFQLRDDLADLFGNPVTSGKRGGDDIRAGKPTELLGTALRLASAAGRSALTDVVGRDDADDDEIEAVRAIFVDSGAVRAIIGRITALAVTAAAALRELPVGAGVDGSVVKSALTSLMTECTDLSFLPVSLVVEREP
ncbi:polyprenyl synthetase family protein [Mycolicibacterium komossense]|uniref:Polyprenyl synthetase family protein n=1 Tax=Mycolicibacterium komossense TaxID=1779 RepID=A0ABT3CCM3_9MYCO|nr:polyprenyl synthetase family protein [Mycolicibacterium komossense]MCV7227244.1 polyprenyl synthetase family protein [Mycolicibacterium komossense]